MGTLVILRHGETPYNVEHRFTGHTDVPLTQRGIEQAHAAGRLLGDMRFDAVYASTLSRAFNTAAYALDQTSLNAHLLNDDGSWKIIKRAEIIERDTGHFTGRCHMTDPEVKAWKRDFDTPVPGGESGRMVVARVQAFFDTVLKPRLDRGETVMVVAHAGIVRAFDVVLGLRDPQEAMLGSVKNAAPLVCTFANGALATAALMEDNGTRTAMMPVAKTPSRKAKP